MMEGEDIGKELLMVLTCIIGVPLVGLLIVLILAGCEGFLVGRF